MINERLVKAIVLVTVMQSLMLIGIEIASFYREQRYIKRIKEMQLFDFTEEDFETEDLLDFTNVTYSNTDNTPVKKLNSKNVITLAERELEDDVCKA